MPVFKKSTKKRENEAAPPILDDLGGTQPMKQLDSRLGLDCYRDFYTLKNYWKTVNRRWKECAGLLMHSPLKMGSGASKGANASVAVAAATAPPLDDGGAVQKVDSRLPFTNFKELFTLKNYWKTVRRNDQICAKTLMHKYLKTSPEAKARYPKLASLSIDSPECSEPAFEGMASNYLKLFDDVITAVEQTPADATSACQRLSNIGKMHRSKANGMKFDDFQLLEAPFLFMISEILQDRFNEKAEMLFRKFFQFCLRYILEGFNS